jgi:hypothetical protein
MLRVENKPTVRRVNHQSSLLQIPSINVGWRINDVPDDAGVGAMVKRNCFTNTIL